MTIADHRASGSVGCVIEEIGEGREDGLVDLDRVVSHVEVGDCIGPDVRSEKERIDHVGVAELERSATCTLIAKTDIVKPCTRTALC